MSSYNIVSSSLMMENHISASVLDSAKGFAAFQSSTGGLILLSIGSDAVFRASVEVTGSQSGWVVTDISDLLAGSYPTGSTCSAGCFASSGMGEGQDFFILLSITVTTTSATDGSSSTFDEVWYLTGPAGTDPSIWLPEGSITFTKLAYDAKASAPIQGIAASTLEVTGLYNERGILPTDSALSLATVADPDSPGELRCFLLSPANALDGAEPGSNVWQYFQQEQNIGIGDLQLAPGRISSDSSWGLYKLYQLNGTPSLTFLPSQGVFGPPISEIFTVPDGSSAIASLVYQPSGSNSSYTDLFVAADGYIGYFSYDQGPPHQAVTLITHTLITGVTQLHAIACGDTVLIWGLNSSGQLFYTTAPMNERATASAWQTPIPLLSNVSDLAPVRSNLNSAIDLFATAPLRSTTATDNSATSNGLLRLTRNNSTRSWNNIIQPLPKTADCITLKTYTTRFLIEDSNNVPQANMVAEITASTDCSLIINGVTQFMQAGNAFSLTTDSSGYISLIHPVSSLATPSFTVTLAGGSTFDISPHGEVTKFLMGLSSSDIENATYTDTDGSTKSLVAPGIDPNAITSVQQSLQAIGSKMSSLPTTKDFNRRSDIKQGAESRSGSEELGGFFSDLGDLVQSITNGFEDIADAVFELVGDAIHFVVTIAGEGFTAIVDTVEDALNAITALLKFIGAEIEAIFRWLAFLFDWSDFITVKDLLKGIVNQSLTSFADVEPQLKAAGDKWFSQVESQIIPSISQGSVSTIPNLPLEDAWSSSQAPPSPVGPNNTDLRSDPRLGWLKDRVNTTPTGDSDGSRSESLSDDPLLSAMEALMGDVKKAFSTALGDIGDLVTGQESVADFFTAILQALELLGVESVKTVFDTFMSTLGSLMSSIEDAFNLSLDIPILSPLYRLFTGSELTLLDLSCLIVSIGLTIIYKIINNESPASALSQSLSLAIVSSTIKSMFSNTTVELSTNHSPLEDMSTMAVDSLQSIGGLLFIIEGITMPVNSFSRCDDLFATANTAYVVGLLARLVRLLASYSIAGRLGVRPDRIIVDLAANSFWLISTFVFIYRRRIDSQAIDWIWYCDGFESMCSGIWQVKGYIGANHCALSQFPATIVDLLAWHTASTAIAQDTEVAGLFVALSSSSALAAGNLQIRGL